LRRLLELDRAYGGHVACAVRTVDLAHLKDHAAEAMDVHRMVVPAFGGVVFARGETDQAVHEFGACSFWWG
jgi:hypothetical protein